MKTDDEKLAQQIKSVFEDYDDGLAENGWAELRKKYPEKENKRLLIWWLTGAAACLLVVIGLHFGNSPDVEKTELGVKAAQKNVPNVVNNIPKKNNDTTIATVAELRRLRLASKRADKPNFKKLVLPQNHVPSSLPNLKAVIAQATANDIAPASHNEVPSSFKTIKNDEVIIANVNADHQKDAEKVSVAKSLEVPQSEVKSGSKVSTEEFLKAESKMLAANTNQKESRKNGVSKTTFDVFTGTFFNYHDDNEAKLSAGIGLNANLKVTEHVVLSFGAGVSQNKVSYQNQVPVQISEAMFTTKNNSLNTAAAPVNGFAYSATATNDVSFNGNMWSIDLPVVIKLYPTKKQDFYISTGINSSTYLSQKYTYNYSVSNFAIQNGTAQPQQQTEKSSFNGFDFANSAIIAVGINQNIGKNILIFEPYYKPALSTMGDKNLRISAAGLNLKFNFNGNAKK